MAGRRTGRVSALTVFVLVAVLAAGVVPAGELRLMIERPPTSGVYRVTGRLQFNPGAIHSPEEVALVTLPDRKPVPFAVLGAVRWPEEGIMELTVAFIAESADIETKGYVMEWGSAASAAAVSQTPFIDKSLPELRFESAEETGVANPEAVLPIGTLMVKVRERPEIWYYWYLAPIFGIIALLIYRKRPYYREASRQ